MTMIPPEVGVADEPTVCVRLNRVWMGYILGAVEKLAFPGWWDTNRIEAQDAVQEILTLLSLGNCSPPEEYVYPESVFIPGMMGEVVSGHTLIRHHDASSDLASFAYQEYPANGDEVWFRFFAAAGDYDLHLNYLKNYNRGKIEIRIDDSDLLATDDLYTSSAQYNQWISHEVSLLNDGVHFLKLKINGKNAGSADYYWAMACVLFVAQSD